MSEAVVLAGGLGVRLREAVPDLPKPMAPVAGRPFLAWLLERLERQGVRHAVLAVGYRAEAIERHFGRAFGALRLSYAHEREPLGTGGALRQALRLIGAFPALALNGDSLVDLDLVAMRATHEAAGVPLTMALAQVEDAGRYGRVVVRDGRVVAFEAKGRAGPGAINAGVYMVEAGLLDDPALGERFSFEKDFLEPRVAALPIAAHLAGGGFIDIGVPADYRRAQTLFAS